MQAPLALLLAFGALGAALPVARVSESAPAVTIELGEREGGMGAWGEEDGGMSLSVVGASRPSPGAAMPGPD